MHRVSTVIATTARTVDLLHAEGDPATDHLRLGRLDRFYRDAASQLPHVITYRDLDPSTISLRRAAHAPAAVRAGRLWLFDVQAGPVVAVLSLDVEADPIALIPILEDCYYDDVVIGGAPLVDATGALLSGSPVTVRDPGERLDLTVQRHQMVFISAVLPEDSVQRLVYRADLDWNPAFTTIQYPAELNRRPTSAAAVGAYVSVLAAQQDYVENCALLSAVQIVAANSQVRTIRLGAHDMLVCARGLAGSRGVLSPAQRRAGLARLVEDMAEQELQLTFGVEAACEIGILVPSLRVENFHRQLVKATGLRDKVGTVSAMLARAASVLAAEQASQAALDAHRGEHRRLRYGVAVGLLSTIAIPVGIVLGFFGGNYSEVDDTKSMFNWARYHAMYLAVLGLIAAAGAVFVSLLLVERHRLRQFEAPRY